MAQFNILSATFFIFIFITVSRGQLVPRDFQNVNLDTYLNNERAVKFQIKCLLEQGPCDKLGKALKQSIPQLLVDQCISCNDMEKDDARKLLSHIQSRFPIDWEKLIRKFQNGGLVKPEDAAKLETILGFKLEERWIARRVVFGDDREATTTERPYSSTTAAPVVSTSTTTKTEGHSEISTTGNPVTEYPIKEVEPETTTRLSSVGNGADNDNVARTWTVFYFVLSILAVMH